MLLMCLDWPYTAQAATESRFTMGMVYTAGAALNPLVCTERDLQSLNALIFESVMALDDDLKPECELALNYEYSASEGVYTFTLRDNVRFHDGNYLTAQDVYETYKYIVSLGSDSPYYTRVQYISDMQVVDANTIKVKGKYSSYFTLYAMTFPVLQRSSLYYDMAVGSGPYWYMARADDYIQVDANPFWWKKAPTVDTLYVYRYSETGDVLTALSIGEVDAVATRSQTAALGRLLNDRTSVDYTTLTYEMLIPNIGGNIFDDVKTRQAIMYAIDITNIANNIYMGMVSESEVPVVTGSWLYEPQSAVYFESLERAYQLLIDAGWGDYNDDGILDKVVDGVLQQFEFNLYTYSDDAAGTRVHAAELIAQRLELLSIKVTVVETTKDKVLKRLKNGNFELVYCGVNMAVLPDLTFLLNSSGRMNYSGYSSGEMNTLLNELYTITDETEFKRKFSEIQIKVAEELPFMGLFFRKGTLMTTADVSGLGAVIEGDVLEGFEYIVFN